MVYYMMPKGMTKGLYFRQKKKKKFECPRRQINNTPFLFLKQPNKYDIN